jgi:molybdenum cofactor biosynthesis enzyme MoaA
MNPYRAIAGGPKPSPPIDVGDKVKFIMHDGYGEVEAFGTVVNVRQKFCRHCNRVQGAKEYSVKMDLDYKTYTTSSVERT